MSYDYTNNYQDPYGYYWPNYTPQPPPVQPQQFSFINSGPAVASAPATHRQPLVPVQEPLRIVPERAPRAQPTPLAGTRRNAAQPFTGKELFDILQTAIRVKYFTAKHGEKGAKDKELGAEIRKLNIMGSDAIFKARIMDMLVYHEDPEKAPPSIVSAIEGSSYAGTFGAPLDLLMAQKRLYEDKTDAEKDKLRKKADEDKRGGEAIRNASLNRSRRTAPEQPSGDEVEITDGPSIAVSVAISAITRTHPTPLDLHFSPVLRSWSPPASILGPAGADFDSDDDIEIISYTPAPATVKAVTTVKAEPGDLIIPAATPAATRKSAKKTPLASIPPRRSSAKSAGKSSSKKRKRSDDSDSDSEKENSPPTRNSKRVRKSKSFDLEGFMQEERTDRKMFEKKMLEEIKQGNKEYAKAADGTRIFQGEFLGLLRDVMMPKN
ncbi:hypothetical protein C8R44DRAFT_870122 [Mycena epipterygia]|nr:hypothetical protein C8R44DRAFT_870122 [Mycena epipterygia]